jgi:anti-sigma B factor antagonist
VRGAINVYSASVLGQAIQSLIADGVKSILLDLSLVGAIDSSGIGTLVGNAKSMASGGGRIGLVGVTGRIRRVLGIMNLERYFEIYGNMEEALAGAEPQAVGQAWSKEKADC